MWSRLFSTPWIGCFVVAGGCIALQLSPLGFLLIFLTFVPSVLFLNLGFVLLAVNAVRNRLPRWSLIFPILWFGGYYTAAFVSNGLAGQLDRQLTANNAVAIRWDRATPILVRGDDGIPTSFVQDYGLNEVFMRSNVGPGDTKRYRLTRGDDCNNRSTPGAVLGYISDGGYGTGRPQRIAEGLCDALDSQEPGETPVKITEYPKVFRSGLVEGYSQEVSITVPQHKTTNLLSADPYWTLEWIPMLQIGCHLEGGFGDRWDPGCSIKFLKGERNGQVQDATTVVVNALGLRKMPIQDRFPDLKWRCMESLRVGQAPPPASYCLQDVEPKRLQKMF